MTRKLKSKSERRAALPEEYRQFAKESIRQCLALPSRRKHSRSVQLMLARAWDKLADQTEEYLQSMHRQRRPK